MGYQFDIGRPLSLPSEKMFFEPLYGLGLEILQGGRPYPHVGVIQLDSYTRKRGINPSLQAGFRLSYRHRRSKFSVKALGNLGLRYHSQTNYLVTLPESPILAAFRAKSDFIAAQASYEYIF